MKTCSLSAFAKEIGVTPQMIDKHKDRLTLVKVKGKKKKQVDTTGKETLEYLLWRRENIDQLPPAIQSEPDEDGPAFERKISSNPTGLASFIQGVAEEPDKSKKSYWDIRLKKEQIEEKKIKNAQKRGDLIEKKLVELLFGKMYQIDVDQIKPLGLDLSPKIIAIVNEKNKEKAQEVGKLLKVSDQETVKQIESILNSGEQEIKTRVISVCEDTSAGILKNVQSEIDNFLNILEIDES